MRSDDGGQYSYARVDDGVNNLPVLYKSDEYSYEALNRNRLIALLGVISAST